MNIITAELITFVSIKSKVMCFCITVLSIFNMPREAGSSYLPILLKRRRFFSGRSNWCIVRYHRRIDWPLFC